MMISAELRNNKVKIESGQSRGVHVRNEFPDFDDLAGIKKQENIKEQ
jgi:hypothetical protein